MKIGVFCSSSDKLEEAFCTAAEQLGEWMGREGHTLVYGGSACGLMERVAQAVRRNGGRVFGVVPRKLAGCASDAIDVTFHCEDLTDRKEWLVGESDVMVALPGSVGTLDEAFSAMAGNVFGMHSKRVVFWNVGGFYDGLFAFLDGLGARGVVRRPWGEVMSRAATLDEVVGCVEASCAGSEAGTERNETDFDL